MKWTKENIENYIKASKVLQKTPMFIVFVFIFLIGYTVSATKPLPPININFNLTADGLQVGKEANINLRFTPLHYDAEKIKVNFKTAGVVTLLGDSNYEWDQNGSGTEINQESKIIINKIGEGNVKAVVNIFKDNNLLYGRSKTIYILATDKKVFTGGSGMLNLKIENLKYLHDVGEINQKEFNVEIDKILRGGAIETGSINNINNESESSKIYPISKTMVIAFIFVVLALMLFVFYKIKLMKQ